MPDAARTPLPGEHSVADHEHYPDLVTQQSHGPGMAPERTFEDALRDLVRNSPYLVISLALHAVVFGVMYLSKEPPIVADETKAIQATAEKPPEIVEPPPPEPPPPDEVIEPIDDPVVSDDPQTETTDDVTNSVDSFDSSPSSTLGLGAGSGSFGRGGGGKLGRRGTGVGPYQEGVDAALRWLMFHQNSEGYWSANAFDDECFKQSDEPGEIACTGRGKPTHDVGVTGLALLAYLGAGNTAKSGRYADTVAAGLKWLTKQQDRSTGNFGDPNSNLHTYDHSIATLAMVEAYALSNKDHRLKKSAQKAIDYLMTLQNPGAAWRYADPASDEMLLHPNDVSVTGWVVMVLTLAKEQDFKFERGALEDAMLFIEEMTDPTTGRTGYIQRGGQSARPLGVTEIWPNEQTEAMTAVAVLCRIFLDPDLERPGNEQMVERGVDIMSKMPIVWNDDPDKIGYRDFYYWYYGSYALYQMGGKDWERWQKGIEVIGEMQSKEGEQKGSWDPSTDPWGGDGGRVYSTAILALTLEVFYRYDTVIGSH
ncbi:MAG: hypothetical protein DHS20C15_12710 [Planctomycetota bacterium]|nr:MAG: hypothetical protein DHS20C15_12710 [Planctomycetota bacterium]